jgi:hypothetical protein
MNAPRFFAIRNELYIHRAITPETSDVLRDLFALTRKLLVEAGVTYRTTQAGAYQLPLLSRHEFSQVSRQNSALLHVPFEEIENSCRTTLFSHIGTGIENVALDGVKSYCTQRLAHPLGETHLLGLTTSDPNIAEERDKAFRGLAHAARTPHIGYREPELPMFVTHRKVPDDIVDTIRQHLSLEVNLQPIEIGDVETRIEYRRRSA